MFLESRAVQAFRLSIMAETAKNPVVLEQCTDARLAQLTKLLQGLDRCQKGLSEYLEVGKGEGASNMGE